MSNALLCEKLEIEAFVVNVPVCHGRISKSRHASYEKHRLYVYFHMVVLMLATLSRAVFDAFV